MKQDIHPDYGWVIFRDTAADFAMLTRSTKKSTQTMRWRDGRDYPVIDIEISSASHPFFTGKVKLLDTAGRVERFNRKYGQTLKNQGK